MINLVCKVLLILLTTGTTTNNQEQFSRVTPLAGTWKIENKEKFEQWGLTQKNKLKGSSYRVKDGKKTIQETLLITLQENKVIYSATVPSQNQGKTIPFTLNDTIKQYLSFENAAHDFPKKIQYHFSTPTKVLVKVLGENDQGFQYYMEKVP